ncbi:flavin reductase family protein [Pseudoduganella lurida]|nr:flavin reductase family protein [Pseudoduganella lurida]
MDDHVAPVDLAKAYRLLNHGPTVLVSARHDGVDDVMAAAWACALDFSPPKVTVVLDKATRTRALVEASGLFVLQVPTARQADLVYAVGSRSLADDPDKLARCGVELFVADCVEADDGIEAADGNDAGKGIGAVDAPLVAGCSAWLACRLVPEPHNQQAYDLFIGEVVAAWADTRVFRDGHWYFDAAGPGWRSLHYIAGGQFYAIGESVLAKDAGGTRAD